MKALKALDLQAERTLISSGVNFACEYYKHRTHQILLRIWIHIWFLSTNGAKCDLGLRDFGEKLKLCWNSKGGIRVKNLPVWTWDCPPNRTEVHPFLFGAFSILLLKVKGANSNCSSLLPFPFPFTPKNYDHQFTTHESWYFFHNFMTRYGLKDEAQMVFMKLWPNILLWLSNSTGRTEEQLFWVLPWRSRPKWFL